MATHRFIGDRHAPTALASVRAQRVVLGTGEVPEALRTMARMRVLGEELETENCDIYFGNSGGPSFAWWNNGTDPRIVGVVSGFETEDSPPRNDNLFARGDGFVNLCAWGRSNWPA